MHCHLWLLYCWARSFCGNSIMFGECWCVFDLIFCFKAKPNLDENGVQPTRINRFAGHKIKYFWLAYSLVHIGMYENPWKFNWKNFTHYFFSVFFCRYKYRKVSSGTDEELQEMYAKMKKTSDQITLEEEYEKVKQMDIDNWEQKRGPRPWEESFEEQSKE